MEKKLKKIATIKLNVFASEFTPSAALAQNQINFTLFKTTIIDQTSSFENFVSLNVKVIKYTDKTFNIFILNYDIREIIEFFIEKNDDDVIYLCQIQDFVTINKVYSKFFPSKISSSTFLKNLLIRISAMNIPLRKR